MTQSAQAVAYVYENIGMPLPQLNITVGYVYLGDVLVGLTHVGWGIPA